MCRERHYETKNMLRHYTDKGSALPQSYTALYSCNSISLALHPRETGVIL